MGSFGARDAIFPLTLRLEFIEPSTTIVHEPPLFWIFDVLVHKHLDFFFEFLHILLQEIYIT